MNDLRKQAARGLKWQGAEILGRQALSLVVFTSLARLLDASALGLAGLVVVYLAFVGMFVDQGIGAALIQRSQLEPEHLSAAFWFNMVGAVAFCLATIALAPAFARFFQEPQLTRLLRWGSLALVINGATAVHTAIFARALNFRAQAIRTLTASVLGGVVAIGMAMAGYGVWSLIGQQLTVSLSGACFLWAASRWRPSLKFSSKHLLQLLGISWSVCVTGVLWFISSRMDQLVVGRFMGTGVLGHYVLGRRLTDLLSNAIHQPIGSVALPALSRLQDDSLRMRNAIYRGMELNALVSFPVFLGVAAVAPVLVPLLFGRQWHSAVPLLQLLCIYNLVLGLFVYCHPALVASGGPGSYAFVNCVGAAGAMGACLLGVWWGPQMLVSALVVNLSVTGLLGLMFLRRRLGLSPWQYCRPCVVPAVASAFMLVAVHCAFALTPPSFPEWAILATSVLFGAGAYFVVVAMLASERLTAARDLGIQAFSRRVPSV